MWLSFTNEGTFSCVSSAPPPSPVSVVEEIIAAVAETGTSHVWIESREGGPSVQVTFSRCVCLHVSKPTPGALSEVEREQVFCVRVVIYGPPPTLPTLIQLVAAAAARLTHLHGSARSVKLSSVEDTCQG